MRDQKTTAYQKIEDFLSTLQIRKYKLEGCYANYSLLAADESKYMGIVDKDLNPLPLYICPRGKKYIVKYI